MNSIKKKRETFFQLKNWLKMIKIKKLTIRYGRTDWTRLLLQLRPHRPLSLKVVVVGAVHKFSLG